MPFKKRTSNLFETYNREKKNDDDDNINRNGRKKDVAQVYILSRSILHYLVQIQRFAYKPNTR